jgi:hypothetical protein
MAYNKKGSAGSKATHVAELTTGQLVLAACTFLVVLLGVFLLGIIVGEYQYKLREDQARAGATAPDQGEGHQPHAFPDLRPRATTTPATTPGAKPDPEPFRPRTAAPPEAVVLPAPSPARPAPAPQTVPQTAPPAPAPVPVQAEAAVPAVPTPLAMLDEAPEPDADAVNMAPSDDADPDEPAGLLPMAGTPPGAPAGTRIYSVQVAALSDVKNAEALKKRIEQATPWPVDIQQSDTRKLYSVLVGRFSTQADADKARDELRKQKEFEKAFVSARRL